MTGLEKYSRPILRDQDQDRQKTVSSGLETKTAVSRTTSLIITMVTYIYTRLEYFENNFTTEQRGSLAIGCATLHLVLYTLRNTLLYLPHILNYIQCLNYRGVGRVEPPSYLLDPPNAVPDFVLGSQYIQHTYDLHRSHAVWKDPDVAKKLTPSYFPTIQTLLIYLCTPIRIP